MSLFVAIIAIINISDVHIIHHVDGFINCCIIFTDISYACRNLLCNFEHVTLCTRPILMVFDGAWSIRTVTLPVAMCFRHDGRRRVLAWPQLLLSLLLNLPTNTWRILSHRTPCARLLPGPVSSSMITVCMQLCKRTLHSSIIISWKVCCSWHTSCPRPAVRSIHCRRSFHL